MKNRTRAARRSFAVAAASAFLLAGGVAGTADAHSPADKAGRGFAAIATPFLEIPANIMQTTEREGPVAGWTRGLAKGLGMTIIRPAVGIYELVTAPFPAPAGYEPILQPEYPWSYFDIEDEVDGPLARR